jgi:lipopolysaccharide export system protein LptC
MTHIAATKSDPQTAHTYWTMGRADAALAFRAARRHSRIVRILRIAIPAGVVLGLTVVFLLTYFNPARMFAKLPVDIGHLVVSGTKITMEKPRLTGFTRDARVYDLTAKAAAQDLTKPNLVELSDIHAKLQMQDKSTMQLTADTGLYNSKLETLKLDKNIVITSSTGYQGWLSEAAVDIRKGHVVSTHTVKVKMLQGTLNAKGLEITNSGEVVHFVGGVDMVLNLKQADLPQHKAQTQ